MKTALQFIAASMLLSSVGLIPLSAAADPDEKKPMDQQVKPVVPEKSTPHPTPAEKSKSTQSSDPTEGNDTDAVDRFSKHIKGITLQHRLNAADTPQPLKQVKADPLILLQTFKQDVLAMMQATAKPLKISSEIKLLLSEAFAKQQQELPSVTVQTEIDATGKGLSKMGFPAYRHEEPAAGEVKKFSADFKGLDGQLEFTEDFANLNYQIDFSGLTLEEDDNYKMVWDKTTSEGKLDADFVPLKTASNLSKMELTNSQENFKMLIENASSETVLEKLKNAVEVHTGNFKLGKFELHQGDTQSKFDRLEANFGGTEQADKVDFFLNTKFNGAVLPKDVLGESLTLHHSSQLALRNLAAGAVIELQQVAREVESQRVKGALSEEAMYLKLFSKFMEVLPKITAKSPEFALSDFNLKTNYGQLTGAATLGISGAKFKSLSDLKSLIKSLQMKSDFVISKKLLLKAGIMLFAEPPAEDKNADKKLSKEAIDKQAEQQAETNIGELVKEKWLVEEGDNYRFAASLSDNKFVVNGSPKPSPLNVFMETTPSQGAAKTPASPKHAAPPASNEKH